jgi:hypothetical protein
VRRAGGLRAPKDEVSGERKYAKEQRELRAEEKA